MREAESRLGEATRPRGGFGPRRAILALDRFLRLRMGIFEYSHDPDCLARIAIIPADADARLADGTTVRKGDRVIDLHFWNDRIPPMPEGGFSLAWGVQMERRFVVSFRALSAYLDSRPDLRDISAVRAETAFSARSGPVKIERIMARWGFESHTPMAAPGLIARLHRFGADLLLAALTWAFNAGALRHTGWKRRHDRFWMARSVLSERYGSPARSRRAGSGARST